MTELKFNTLAPTYLLKVNACLYRWDLKGFRIFIETQSIVVEATVGTKEFLKRVNTDLYD